MTLKMQCRCTIIYDQKLWFSYKRKKNQNSHKQNPKRKQASVFFLFVMYKVNLLPCIFGIIILNSQLVLNIQPPQDVLSSGQNESLPTLPLADASFWNDLSRKRPKGGIDVTKHSKEARLFNIFSSASEENNPTDDPPKWIEPETGDNQKNEVWRRKIWNCGVGS